MSQRNKEGNMLAMVAATAFLIIAIMMFGLTYLNVSRANLEQKTAAEAAALAAAQDIGRIVVNTPECGYVSLCDIAPCGKGTLADDNYFCEVRSINELMATARLDYIIGTQLNDSFMKSLALQDRDNILKAKKKLDEEIKKTLVAGGTAKDAYGNEVKTYDDAFAIYMKNLAKASEYVPPTLTLSYGSLNAGIGTQISVANPGSKAQASGSQTLAGCYVSDTNIPYDGENFVFASTGKRVALGDLSKYSSSIDGLPYQMPAVVRVDADQKFQDQGKNYVQHFAACATTGNDVEHTPGGALTISFPDGPVDELTCPSDLFTWSEMTSKHCDVLSADGGDFPVDAPKASIVPPMWIDTPTWPASPPSPALVSRLGVYDWIRAAGSGVNVDSVVNMFKPGTNGGSSPAAFNAPSSSKTLWKSKDPKTLLSLTLGMVPKGVVHIYSFAADGSILYRSKDAKPEPYTAVAEKQLYAELADGQELNSKTASWSILGINLNVPDKSNLGSFLPKLVDFFGTNHFDFYVRDQVRERGVAYGGSHDGSSMDCDMVASSGKSLEKQQLLALSRTTAASSSYDDNSEVGGNLNLTIGGVGIGIPPTISKQDDFATSTIPAPQYNKYSKGPSGGKPRPTYTKTGLAVELRFRRQAKVGDLLAAFEVGYVGEMD